MPNFAAAHGMCANPQSFYESKLFQRKFFGLVQKGQGNGQKLLHSTVYMDADHAKLFAAIGAACLAWLALPTTNVRFYGATVAGADAEIIRANFDYFSGKFMPEHSGICIDRVASGECVKIASTDAYLADANECFSRRKCGNGHIPFHKLPGVAKDDLPHRNPNYIMLANQKTAWWPNRCRRFAAREFRPCERNHAADGALFK